MLIKHFLGVYPKIWISISAPKEMDRKVDRLFYCGTCHALGNKTHFFRKHYLEHHKVDYISELMSDLNQPSKTLSTYNTDAFLRWIDDQRAILKLQPKFKESSYRLFMSGDNYQELFVEIISMLPRIYINSTSVFCKRAG